MGLSQNTHWRVSRKGCKIPTLPLSITAGTTTSAPSDMRRCQRTARRHTGNLAHQNITPSLRSSDFPLPSMCCNAEHMQASWEGSSLGARPFRRKLRAYARVCACDYRMRVILS